MRKSNYAKTEGPIKMIFRRLTAIVIANIVLKFGDNQPKGRGSREVNLGKIEEKF